MYSDPIGTLMTYLSSDSKEFNAGTIYKDMGRVRVPIREGEALINKKH